LGGVDSSHAGIGGTLVIMGPTDVYIVKTLNLFYFREKASNSHKKIRFSENRKNFVFR
jgi:hypothetical protein